MLSLQNVAAPQAWRLLRFLLLRFSKMSANAGEPRLLICPIYENLPAFLD